LSETNAFLSLARERIAQGSAIDLGALEIGLRAALLKDGCGLLQDLLRYSATLCDRSTQHQAGEKVYHHRRRTVETVLGQVALTRDYFYCEERQSGRAPFDQTLGLIDGYSPGLARLMCRIAAQQSYELAAADLLVYAGVGVEGRAIQRMANLMGPPMRETRAARPEPAASKSIPVMYVSADGTGIPMTRSELEGRSGRQPDGSARTREVKLGCVFTQHVADAEGHPLRDPSSTTYLGTLENAAAFGLELRQEAIRRGLGNARKTVFLGDGAAWVWELARINFPGAIGILDFYHAFEHLGELSVALDGAGPAAKKRTERWAASMKKGAIGQIIASAQKTLDRGAVAEAEEARKQIEYFRKNQHRMHYDQYRREQLFIGSGVVEAGCKTVIGQRLKKSGMFWSESGAQNVIDLRCALHGGHFDSDWSTLINAHAA
jgi:hypothetical protein